VAGGAVTAGERALDGSSDRKAVPPPVPAEASPGAVERSGSVEAPRGASDAGEEASAPGRARRGDNGRPERAQRGRARSGAPGARGNGNGAPPVDAPVRAKGSPPAVGRARRGLAPPPGSARPTEPKGGSNRPAEPPGAQKKAAKPEPPPKLLAPGQLREKPAKIDGE